MRKLTIALLAVGTAASLLFAQGSAEDKKSGGQASGDGGLVTINLWYPASMTEAGPLPDDWAGYQKLKDELGINLVAQTLPSGQNDQDMKIQTASAADDLPDFFSVSRTVWTNLVERGMVADVTDLYSRMPERSKIMFNDDAKRFVTVDGRMYGFASPSKLSKSEAWVIRKDWLDKLGLEVPTNLDELFEVMKAFTYDDPDGNGKDDTYGFGAFVEVHEYEEYPGRRFEPLMGAFGVDGTWDMTKENAGLNIEKPEFYDFMVYLKKMIDAGVIDPNWMAYKKDDFRGAWKQGKFGIMRENCAALHMQANYAPFDKNFPDGEWLVIEPPTGPDGDRSMGPNVEGLRIFAISQKAADEGKAEKIADMYEWMSYGEGYMLTCFGEEGKQYEMVDGIPKSVDPVNGYDAPEGRVYVQLRNLGLNWTQDAELKSVFPTYETEYSHKTIDVLDTFRKAQALTWTSANGIDSMPVPSTDLDTFYQQGLSEFLAGKRELTPENWKAFIDQFNQIGGSQWEQEGIAYATKNGYLI